MASHTVDPALLAQGREDLAALLRISAVHGYNEGIDNHFSLAVPGRTDLFLLNRFGPHWSEMTSDDIITVVIPEFVTSWRTQWLHNGSEFALKARLLHRPHTAVVSVPLHMGNNETDYDALEPLPPAERKD